MSEAGQVLASRYRLERILGEGAMARTWLAVDVEAEGRLGAHPVDLDGDGVPDAARVAIKELPLSRLRRWKDYELFEREAQTLEALAHPGIPRFIDHFVVEEGAQQTFYLVEEWIDGESLLDWLHARVKLPEGTVRRVLREVLEILCYLHIRDKPVIHRDLKPANVMIRPDGQLVVIDFGAVRELLHEEDDDGSTVVGTFGYMPPEQLHGRASVGSDLYALAATACHLLAGLPPRDMPLKGRPFMLDFRPHCAVSHDLAELLDAMLEPELEDRLCDADQVLALLEAIERTAAPAEVMTAPTPEMAITIPTSPRALERPQVLYALSLAPTWRYATLLVGFVAAFFGPPGWLVTAATGTVGSLNLREAWANLEVMRRGAILSARVAALRPTRGGVELEYTYTFKRRTYLAALVVRSALVASVGVGSVIEVAVDPLHPEDSVPLLGGGKGLGG